MSAQPGSRLVLVLNAGSSSIKFAVFEGETALSKGQFEGIGATPRLRARDAAGALLLDRHWEAAVAPKTHEAALGALIEWLDGRFGSARISAIGHRVVHGGPDLAAPMLIDPPAMAALRALVPLAPLHQPHNIAGIEAAGAAFPGVPQVACFDTAFHRTQPWVAETFALPPHFFDAGIRRYGFHGLSYEFIAAGLEPDLAGGRVVVAHLGNGASLCAIEAGRSVATSMSFTALDGVPMGTRCGQIDPGVVLHMIEALGMDPPAIAQLLYRESGLKGMSGVSQDVREIEAAGSPRGEGALAHFAYRVRREIAALTPSLGGLDALIFTAGIGENAPALRGRICAGLGFMGITLDAARNAANEAEISPPGAPVRVLVRRTDEEAMIARHTRAVLAWTGGTG